MSEPLRCTGLGHAYGATPVLDTVDLAVEQGAFVSVLGSSGCGKTTLLRAIAGLVTPTTGHIEVGGVEVVAHGVEKVRTEHRRVGLVFQDYALFPSLDVSANVGFAIDDPARVHALLTLVGLEALSGRKPDALSGGQQQRVALARALAPRPRLLLLDEPFANVDADRREQLGAELRDITRREGSSVLLVTHDRRDALALSDRLVVLEPGPRGAVVAQSGAPDALYLRPVNAYVATLTGPCWFLEGTARGDVAETVHGQVRLAIPRTGPVLLMVRPEQARFVPGGPHEVTERRFVDGRWQTFLSRGRRCEGAAQRGDRGELAFPQALWPLPDV